MRHANTLGRTLIIANPVAQNGKAERIAEQLQRTLQLYLHDDGAFDMMRTERPRHAVELAADAAKYDTVLALGGDGIIHEVANGLMRIPGRQRPALGVIPVGSGNDYARTLGADLWRDEHLPLLLNATRTRMDIGRISYRDVERAGTRQKTNESCVEYFVQTCSFGLDAAIGLDTHRMRTRTNLTGAPLYAASGLNIFGLHYRPYPARVAFDRNPPHELDTLLMAVQIGPTYGSGFLICPDADPQDGSFDICYACGPYPRALALPLFLSAKNGHHVGHRRITMRQAQRLDLSFRDADYPIQADGERIRAAHMTIECLPRVLTVLQPARRCKNRRGSGA